MNKSHDYDKILTRLTTILQRLYSGETLSVTELAEEFNVSTKTIQRDFNERLIRFPIEKTGRRWRMQQGFGIEKIQDIDNLLTLQILETIAGSIGKGFEARSKALLGKLKNATQLPIQSYLPIEDITSHAALFSLLESAITSSTALRFNYHEKPRLVHPYRIVNFDGYWYLLGFEPKSGLVKKFYIKEIRGAEPTEHSFIPDPKLKERLEGALNAWFDPNCEPFELHLLAKRAIVKYLERRPLSPSQHLIARHANGDIEVVIKATSVPEAVELLKTWLPDLIVLAPTFVKEAYEKTLSLALRRENGHDAV
ncbi:helix-turn-helix transcriptional regulator [Hydrogenimonas cancrithermarum]|uniref:Transcriptional regulator n=1 Tax=Hydrogenimonas cancrithermarum TaxID=2993563 RepID=A0ABM8FN63_9BACT|nr:WYL domain-containing protein [Hydrogenimonas cancrithermarum]BDY13188.1 transcriptional regulator [Hydrogenimonas cancrithermarum]